MLNLENKGETNKALPSNLCARLSYRCQYSTAASGCQTCYWSPPGAPEGGFVFSGCEEAVPRSVH
jgi:hypothetical protein